MKWKVDSCCLLWCPWYQPFTTQVCWAGIANFLKKTESLTMGLLQNWSRSLKLTIDLYHRQHMGSWSFAKKGLTIWNRSMTLFLYILIMSFTCQSQSYTHSYFMLVLMSFNLLLCTQISCKNYWVWSIESLSLQWLIRSPYHMQAYYWSTTKYKNIRNASSWQWTSLLFGWRRITLIWVMYLNHFQITIRKKDHLRTVLILWNKP